MNRILRTAILTVALASIGFTANAAEVVVKKGNNLIWLAGQHNVSWQAMLVENEAFLKEMYEETCESLSKEYRERTEHRTALQGGNHFCNDTKIKPYGNTLKPGWKLTIPSDQTTPSVEKTVTEIRGNNIALVIDITGSMDDKRSKTSQFYFAALKKIKKVSGVYLYADGNVDKLEAGGVKEVEKAINLGYGDYENTRGALLRAGADKPDAIILLTDEPGDDWKDWAGVRGLPPVYAHCLPNGGRFTCRSNLERLARETGGKYIEGFAEPAVANR